MLTHSSTGALKKTVSPRNLKTFSANNSDRAAAAEAKNVENDKTYFEHLLFGRTEFVSEEVFILPLFSVSFADKILYAILKM